MIIFTYMFLLLLIIIIIINGLVFCLKYAPLKIRILSLIVLSALIFRYITLIIFYIHKSINYLYPLRVFYFINMICIPIIALIILYILSRSNKIKFKVIIIISLIFFALYSILIVNGVINLMVLNNSFYSMAINYPKFVKVIYLIINILFMVASIFLLNKANINRIGISLILMASIVTTLEILLNYIGIYVLPEAIIGDLSWVIALNYALYELKK